MSLPDEWTVPRELRLMWDYADWPLWREDGLDDDEPEYLRQVLCLSSSLITALRAWTREAELHLASGRALGASEDREEALDALDGWGKKLEKRLREELPPGIPVRYVS